MMTLSLVLKLKNIKALVCDVDGTLTQGWVTYSEDLQPRRFYNIRDGFGLVQLRKIGYRLGWITASQAADISHRAKLLGIDFFMRDLLISYPRYWSFVRGLACDSQKWPLWGTMCLIYL